MSRAARPRPVAGFSLIEVMVALSILMVGLLGLAQVFYVGMANASTSSSHLIAREKAREAIESVHTARDTRTIIWGRSATSTRRPARHSGGPPLPMVDLTAVGGGVFLNGEQPLRQPGADGLVNTGDDAAAGPEELPGANGRFEPAGAPTDDVPLNDFWRRSTSATSTTTCGKSPYDPLPRRRPVRTYSLTTYVSSFS